MLNALVRESWHACQACALGREPDWRGLIKGGGIAVALVLERLGRERGLPGDGLVVIAAH